MRTFRWEYRLVIVISVISVLLILLMFVEWMYGMQNKEDILQSVNRPLTVSFDVEELPEYDFLQNPTEFYTEMVNRPLFIKGRRPLELTSEEEAAQNAPTKPAKAINLKLTGSLDTPGHGAYVLFQNPVGKTPEEKHLRLKVGEEYEGWRIKAIYPDKVIVASLSEEKEILLQKASPAAPKITPRRKAPPRTPRQRAKPRKTKKTEANTEESYE